MIKNPPQELSFMPLKFSIVSMIAFELLGFFSCLLTGICILDKREWARISLILLSILALLLGLFIMIVALSNVNQFWLFALLNLFFLIAIPSFFLFFFNTKGIRQIFVEEIDK